MRTAQNAGDDALSQLFFVRYDLSSTLHSPFGPRALDVYHESIARGLRTLAEKLMDGASEPPAE